MRRLAPLALLAALPLLAGPVEVYGRPLRGLTPASVADVAAHPERFRDKLVRVEGPVREASGARVVLGEGSATLALETDGSFAFPGNLAGARLTAEGKLRGGEALLVASGIEVRR